MPIYEFECKGCGRTFEHLSRGMQPDAEKAACPNCHSRNTVRKLSVFAVAQGASTGSAAESCEAPGGSCCCGGGACRDLD